MTIEEEKVILEKAINYYKTETLKIDNLIKTAKTDLKKNYYKKKLKTNNKIFADFLYLYDKLHMKSQ